MGQKKQRTERFLAEYPFCCFCGAAPSTTVDHLPPRSVFNKKKWPVGFEFPACARCNNGSWSEDSLFAMASRIYGAGESGETEEFLKLALSFHERFPEAARSMAMTANEVRSWMRSLNIEIPAGETYSGAPIVRLPPVVQQALLTVGAKLMKALHFKHTGLIVPVMGEVQVRWWPNTDKELGLFPSDVIRAALPRKPEAIVSQDGTDLVPQFTYLYQLDKGGELGVYAAFFRASFALLGTVAIDPRHLDEYAALRAPEI